MIANQIVENSQWVWHVGISALIIWAVFIWKEWSHVAKPKFYINISISFIAIVSLALVILKPLVSNSKKQAKIALLTTGHNTFQLDSLKKAHKKLKIYNYSDSLPILKSTDYPSSIFILGQGIKAFDLWQLDTFETVYLGGNDLKGICDLKYNTSNTVGTQALFKGRYLNATAGHKLILKSPGGEALDSITLISKETQEFQLSTNLKVKGKFLFEIIEKDSLGNSITKDPIPVNVSERIQLKIAIINHFPTFETKYLKNFLAEKGHEVLIRSQLTKARFKFEYFNMKNRPRIEFSKDNLSSFDLIIIDAISLQSLSKNQRNSLENSIHEQGLGLFIQADHSYFKSSRGLFSFNFDREKNNKTTLKEWPRVNIATHEFRFKNEFTIHPVFSNSTKIYSAYKRVGLGRIGSSVFQNTFEVLLKGHTEAYQQLWSKTIEALSKTESPVVEWDTNAQFAFKNEPFNFKLRTAITQPSVFTNEASNIPLRQDIDLATVWSGTSYPRDIGWKKQYVEQDTTRVFEYYVHSTQQWKTLIANTTMTTNKRHFSDHDLKNQSLNKPKSPINSIWLFLFFILSMGYLWLEPKL